MVTSGDLDLWGDLNLGAPDLWGVDDLGVPPTSGGLMTWGIAGD